jgi:hypothetical protein
MPIKSRDIAAVPINGAQSNRSFYKQHNHSYLCGGCANHLADVRIAFEDFNGFYIDNDFIIAVENED